MWIGDQPMLLMKASGVIMNFILGFSAIHTLAVNMILFACSSSARLVVAVGAYRLFLFFIGIPALGTPSV